MSVILMITLFYKALILQGEIWCWSLLGLKGLKRVPYLFIFVIRENEILIAVIRDSLFFLFVNRARDPPCTTLF